MGNENGRENTHIANACSGEIRIFFQSAKLHIQEIAIDVTTDSGVSVKENVEAHMNVGTKLHVELRPDMRLQFFRCASRQVTNIASQGDIFLTIICNRGAKEDLMCYNLRIPSDRSVIAIDNGMVKLSRYGHLWMDEEGRYW